MGIVIEWPLAIDRRDHAAESWQDDAPTPDEIEAAGSQMPLIDLANQDDVVA